MAETTSIPVWLDAPPDGSLPAPPVETLEQGLPFDKLSWKDFERLILRIVRRESDIEDCSLYGTQGQAQDGIDIHAVHRDQTGLRVCYQCKKVAEFGPSEIATAIDKFLSGKWADRVSRFVLCAAVSLQRTQKQDELDRQRQRLAEQGITLYVWDGAPSGALSERLKNSPDLVDDFFGRPWVERFNGKEAATSLGDRLNGYELQNLQARLFQLYSTIFAQHDPGLRIDGERNVDYRARYVHADVTEQAEAATPLEPDRQQSRDNDEVPVPPEPDRQQSRGAYEADVAQGQRQIREMDGRPSTDRLPPHESRRPALQWLQDHRDCVVLGEPGYGKSALLRYLTLSILQPDTTAPDLLSPQYFNHLPVWISFARLTDAVVKKTALSVEDFFLDWLHQHSFDEVQPLFARAVRGRQVLLLLDGLDEATSDSSGREALDRVVTFLNACDARIICTSRPRGFTALSLPSSWKPATLTPLSDEKIEQLATQWFAIVESDAGRDGQATLPISAQTRARAQAYLRAVQDNPKTLELARSPLLCQALIESFRYSHRLPEARVAAYEQIVALFLSRHPAARAQAGGVAQPVERLGLGLKSNDLKDILIRLAWKLRPHDRARHLSRAECEESCAAYLEDEMHGLGLQSAQARRQAKAVIDQLLEQYGMLVERAPDEFNFIHLSIQEYLMAEWVAREPPDGQLKWLSEIWSNPAWRESLICWFGILGGRSERALSEKASQRLVELGEAGAWQRMLSLELRAEIATADLRLPVREARRVVEQATHEVETSAFPEFRTSLTRSLTLGALGSSVQEECKTALQRWMPGRPAYTRAGLLRSFKAWEPSDELRSTLLRAHHDESARCRRAASETFATVFSASADTSAALKQLAVHHVLPEVRAAALHGLASRPEWSGCAVEAAEANLGSCNSELLLVACRTRVREGLHDGSDFDRVWRLWKTEAVDFEFRDELVDLPCAGWPQHSGLRNTFVRFLQTQQSTWGIELPLEYLVRCYPDDDEVAAILAGLFERFGMHFSIEKGRLWKAMISGYKGHPTVSSALRATLKKHRTEYKTIFWHPQTVPALNVLGDDEARDDLLSSYETTDFHGRYWIATALFAGWSHDKIAQERIQSWRNGSFATAAPLTEWAPDLLPDVEQREGWLRRLATESGPTKERHVVEALLSEFPDPRTKQLAEESLDCAPLWYYDKMRLEGLFASKFPDDPRSLEIVERSLCDVDGPNPGDFAASFQGDGQISKRLLAASVTAPTDVRMAVASVLRSRAVDYETIVATTPEPFAEGVSAVRTSCLMAHAQAASGNQRGSEELAEALAAELAATGMVMDLRHRSALSGLLELGLIEKAVEILAEQGNGWTHRLVDSLDRDPVLLSALIKHWDELQPLLSRREVESELPVEMIIHVGYDALLEQTSLGRAALDKYLDEYFNGTQSRVWVTPAHLEAMARRHSGSKSLRRHLLALIGSLPSQGIVLCTAARLMAKIFPKSPDIWIDLSKSLESPEHTLRLVPGVLGYLVLGWPDGVVASWVRSVSDEQRALWSPRDRLLIAVASQDAAAAEAAASGMLAEPLEPWRYNMEDMHALRIWAQSRESSAVLTSWIESENPSLSLTALSLAVNGYADVVVQADTLLERFNAQMNATKIAPPDGLDAAGGRHASWPVRVYSSLNARSSR